jgi:hypothetical protein
MDKIKLQVVPRPLDELPDKGRVILAKTAMPLKGKDGGKSHVCGKCGSNLMIGFHRVRFHQMFPNSQVLLECKKCMSYNDATPEGVHVDSNLVPIAKEFFAQALESRNRLYAKYNALDPIDPRLLVGSNLLDIAHSNFLNLIHFKDNLRSDEWWVKQGFEGAVKAGVVTGLLENHMSFTAGSLMFFSFSLFEAGLRRIVRAIDAAACSSGNAEFKSIYEWLLKRLHVDGWVHASGSPGEFLDLYRTFRNTLHNNGVFFSRNGTNQDIEWNGKKYNFVYGKAPEFVDWKFNFTLLSELVVLNESIMNATMIAGLPQIA